MDSAGDPLGADLSEVRLTFPVADGRGCPLDPVSLDLPDDASGIQIDSKPDGVYVVVDVYNADGELLESHEYAIGPEAPSYE